MTDIKPTHSSDLFANVRRVFAAASAPRRLQLTVTLVRRASDTEYIAYKPRDCAVAGWFGDVDFDHLASGCADIHRKVLSRG